MFLLDCNRGVAMNSIQVTRDTFDQGRAPVFSPAPYLLVLTSRGGPIADTLLFDLRKSMKNVGEPACPRLRVALNEREIDEMNPSL
ncbi:N-succinylarginine dihydrolase (plasmid) [Mycetohabitans rhizoxinica]